MPWTTGDVDKFKKGLNQSQKQRWVRIANSVLEQCLNEGKPQSDCESAAIRQANGAVNNMHSYSTEHSDYKIREEYFEGRKHIVVPVVMMAEGVHHGSQGPLLYTTEELGKFTQAWNGVPVVIGHPSDEDGNSISANSPEVINKELVGRIYNTHMDGDKLRAEAWIDAERLSKANSETLNMIQSSQAIDVSVGVFTEDEFTEGEFGGEHYERIARNLRPDHLALLPGAVGACSWDDGCGIRANDKGGKMNNNFDALKKEKENNGHPIANEGNYMEVIPKVSNMLDSMDSERSIHFLEALYEDYLIYRRHDRDSQNERLFKQAYNVADDGSIEFESDPVEVQKQVEYTEMSNNEALASEDGQLKFNFEQGGKMSKNCEKIGKLINHEATKFTEDDRKWLSNLEDEALDKLFPDEQKDENIGEEGKEVETEDPKVETQEAKEITEKKVMEVLNQVKDPEEYINKYVPEFMRDQVREGLKMHENKRKELIKGITDNSSFAEENVKDWKTEDLQKLHDSVVPKTDYSVFSAPTNNQGHDAINVMLGINENEKEDK